MSSVALLQLPIAGGSLSVWGRRGVLANEALQQSRDLKIAQAALALPYVNALQLRYCGSPQFWLNRMEGFCFGSWLESLWFSAPSRAPLLHNVQFHQTLSP
jgi:hypothetical protein